MIKKAVIASIIILGAGLVFSQLLQSGAGPKATFSLSAEQLEWLISQGDLSLELEESGARNVEAAPTACYAKRTLSFDEDGTAPIRQIRTDDESRTFIQEIDTRWRIEDALLCLDTRPLDRDPACWRVIYRDGTLELENEAHAIRWFARLNDSRSPDEFLHSLYSAKP